MRCTVCGLGSLLEFASVCPRCGARRGGDPLAPLASKSNRLQVLAAVAAQARKDQAGSPLTRPSRRPTTWMWVVAVAVAGLLFAGFGAGFTGRPMPSAGTSRTTSSATSRTTSRTTSAPTSPAAAAAPVTARRTPSVSHLTSVPARQQPKLGTPVTAGPLVFNVTGFVCGLKKVHTSSWDIMPQGQFCRLSVTVKNTSKQAITVRSGDITLRDASANIYSASQDTSWLAEVLYAESINPGNSLSRNMYYDVPKTTTPATAVCTGGSGAAIVSLR